MKAVASETACQRSRSASGAVSVVRIRVSARSPNDVLFDEELVLVTAPGRSVTLEGVAAEPFVCLPSDSGLRALLDGACARGPGSRRGCGSRRAA